MSIYPVYALEKRVRIERSHWEAAERIALDGVITERAFLDADIVVGEDRVAQNTECCLR
jgi:hypothetical protein